MTNQRDNKKFFVSVFLIGCVLMTAGCDNIYRLLDKNGAEEKDLVGEVVPFEANPTVEEVQALLKIYGYSVGEPDGVLGPRTRDAIEKFQEDNELEVSRFIDQQTWQKLKTFQDLGFIEQQELNIKKVQMALQAAGFDVGTVDGKYGPKTEKALKDFQKKHQLKVDGKIGYHTLSALNGYLSP